MFKKITIAVFLLFAALTVQAQSHTYCPTDGNCTWSGTNTFTGPVHGLDFSVAPGFFTVSTLPDASTHNGLLAYVTDGSTTSDCTVGGGTSIVLCSSTGSVWKPIGSGTAVKINSQIVTNPNFNSSTPAIPANNTGVQWQSDMSGNITGYVATGGTTVNCTGTGDTARINAALAQAGGIRIAGNCVLDSTNGHLLYFPNSFIDRRGATFTYPNPTAGDYIWVNNATLNPTIQDIPNCVTTAGGAASTLTCPSGSFTIGQVGYPIRCEQAKGAGSNYDLETFIASFTSSAVVILSDPAGAAISPVTCHVTTPDKNITIVGGTDQFTGTGPIPLNSKGMIRCTSCQNVIIEDTTSIEPLTGTSTGMGHIQVGNSQDVIVRNTSSLSALSLQDGVDFFGPFRNGFIYGSHGTTGDDLNALLANPCFPVGSSTWSDCTFGQISGVYIGQTSGGTIQGTTGVKVRAGAGAGISNVHVDGLVCDNKMPAGAGGLPGCAIGVFVGDETGNAQLGTQGALTNISTNNVSGVIRGPAFELIAASATGISASNLSDDLPSNATKHLVVLTSAGTSVYNNISFSGLRPNVPLTQGGVHILTGVTVNGLNLSDVQYQPSTTTTVDMLLEDSGATLNNANLSDFLVKNLNSCYKFLGTQSGLTAINMQSSSLGLANSCQNTQIGLIVQNLTPGTGTVCPNGPNGALVNSGCASASGVISINSSPGAFTFNFSAGAGSCSGTTCSFTGSGTGGNTTSTSLSTNSLSKSNGANSIIDSLFTDDGTNGLYLGTGGLSSSLMGTHSLTISKAISLAGNITFAEGNASVIPSAGNDNLYGDITTHRLLMNLNNTGFLKIPGIATAGTAGNCVQLATNGIDIIDSTTVCRGGSVTSVALTLPAWLTVAGTPITTAGTFAVTPTTGQTSHQVIGTCGSGTTFAPCALVATDIPTLNQNTSGTAANLSGTPALPNGTTGTTQTVGDNSTKLATTAFVLANVGSGGLPCSGTCTLGFLSKFGSGGTSVTNSLLDDGITAANTLTYSGAGGLSLTGTAASHGLLVTEGTALSGSAGLDILTADSTAHWLKYNYNNGTTGLVAGVGTAGVVSGDIVTGTGTQGLLQDSGTLLTNLFTLNTAQSVTAAKTFPGGDLFFGGVNKQTGTTYTFVAADCNKLVSFNNAASVAVTLPVATTTGFGSGCVIHVTNIGAGTVTITPTTSNINGNSTQALATGQGTFLESDGTNYSAWVSGSGGGGSLTGSGTAGTLALWSGATALAASSITVAANVIGLDVADTTAKTTVTIGNGSNTNGTILSVLGNGSQTGNLICFGVSGCQFAINGFGGISMGGAIIGALNYTTQMATGTPTTTGSSCGTITAAGGASRFQFTSTTTGSCSVVITTGATATNGWECSGKDLTTTADTFSQTATTTTTCTVTAAAVVTGDKIIISTGSY